MRKLLGVLLLIGLLGCTAIKVGESGQTKSVSKETNQAIEESLSEEIAKMYKQEGVDYKDDKVYFIYGLEEDYNPATNVRYRGILYSKRLAEMNAAQGLEVGLVSPSMGGAGLYNYAKQYTMMFRSIEIDSMVEKKAKEIFGEKTTLYNDWSMTPAKYEHLKEIIGQKNIEWDNKNGAYRTIVNVYGEELENLNIDEYKQKTFELSKFIYEYMNYCTSLQIFVRDKSYFKNYDLVKYSVYKSFRNRTDIKAILAKIERKEELTDNEEKVLVNSFEKGLENVKGSITGKVDYKRIISWFDNEKKLPIEKDKMEYFDWSKNGKIIYSLWDEEYKMKKGLKKQ